MALEDEYEEKEEDVKPSKVKLEGMDSPVDHDSDDDLIYGTED